MLGDPIRAKLVVGCCSPADEVFTLPGDTTTSGYPVDNWHSVSVSEASAALSRKPSNRPTILVNDVWDPQNSAVDSTPSSG